MAGIMERLEKFLKEFQELYPKEEFSPIRNDLGVYWVAADTNYYEILFKEERIVLDTCGIETKHPNLTPEMAGTVLDALLTESWKE